MKPSQPPQQRQRIPQTEVLDWLKTQHPKLHETAVLDRQWVWITESLATAPEVRASVKGYGFRFAKAGHALTSGKSGTWGHSCEKPLPFRRGGGKPKNNHAKPANEQKPATQDNHNNETSGMDPEILAWLNQQP